MLFKITVVNWFQSLLMFLYLLDFNPVTSKINKYNLDKIIDTTILGNFQCSGS